MNIKIEGLPDNQTIKHIKLDIEFTDHSEKIDFDIPGPMLQETTEGFGVPSSSKVDIPSEMLNQTY